MSIVNAQSSPTPTPRDGYRLHPGIDMEGSLIVSVSDSARTVFVDPTAVSFDSDGHPGGTEYPSDLSCEPKRPGDGYFCH